MKLIDWQVNWRNWHFSYSKEKYDPMHFDWHEVYIFIGPLQMRFWSS